jgi:hypothetical protein
VRREEQGTANGQGLSLDLADALYLKASIRRALPEALKPVVWPTALMSSRLKT